ncbi:MAG: acetylglutamate kinase, partial [Clostridia bacterium]|nr:acetylglutamate kinase [Clostridia bacterium]
MDKQEQAKFLIEALPHIRKYFNKVLVVKYGGNAMIDDELKSSVMRDLSVLHSLGIKIVLVHGGGPEISETVKKMGLETKWINGLRYTDKETAEVVRMVLAGKVNKSLVGLLE